MNKLAKKGVAWEGTEPRSGLAGLVGCGWGLGCGWGTGGETGHITHSAAQWGRDSTQQEYPAPLGGSISFTRLDDLRQVALRPLTSLSHL